MKRYIPIFACLFAWVAGLTGCNDTGVSAASSGSAPAENTAPQVIDVKSATLVRVAFESGEKFELREAADLAILRTLISDASPPPQKCAYDGKIGFVKGKDLLLAGQFNLNSKCQRISFMQGGALVTRKMSERGAALLAGLRQSSGPGHTAADLAGLQWIIGEWGQVEKQGVLSIELWKEESPTRFAGSAFTLQGGDTIYIEQLALELEDGKIYYIPTIPSNAGPVKFKLTSKSSRSAVFENPEHDFPQMITYKLVEDSILHARISGKKNGEEGFKDFYMRKLD